MADGNNVPNRKVVVGAACGALMTIVAWGSKAFAGVEIPADVALAGSTVLVFLVQYLFPTRSDIMTRILVGLCFALCLAGCPLLKSDSTQAQTAKLAVQYGTLKYLGRVSEVERQAKAQRIRAIVTEVENLAKGEPVSLALLESAIRKQLPADLKPEDAFAVNALLGLVMAELQARIGEGLLNEQQLLVVSEVASWAIDATEFYSATGDT